MRGLAVADIIVLHQKVIDKTGGSHGIRDIGLVELIWGSDWPQEILMKKIYSNGLENINLTELAIKMK